MTEQTPQMLTADDPRFAFAKVTDAVGTLMEATDDSALGLSTPCPDFTVKELLEHLVLVMRRAGAVGRGEHFSTTQQEAQDSGWAESYREAAHGVMEAWTDPAKLGQDFELPWGVMPGGGVLVTYTAELAVHGWDLATAIGADFTIDDDLLQAALVGVKFIPAEGRDLPEIPFGDVVDPGPDAPALLQIAGWMGRRVLD